LNLLQNIQGIYYTELIFVAWSACRLNWRKG